MHLKRLVVRSPDGADSPSDAGEPEINTSSCVGGRYFIGRHWIISSHSDRDLQPHQFRRLEIVAADVKQLEFATGRDWFNSGADERPNCLLAAGPGGLHPHRTDEVIIRAKKSLLLVKD